MKVDRDQFMDRGYLVFRNLIPPDKLDSMRAGCETMLERQKAIWARERAPDDPPGGEYETSRQPRVMMMRPGLIDAETAHVVEDFWVADQTLEIASQLLCNPEPCITEMMMMCNPVRDWPGGTGWHRDVHPVDMAPLDALQADVVENGPRYTQWNVPLYDDSVLWVIPGSHRRRSTAQERAELLADRAGPVTGGVPVELNAGDGVVYFNYLNHTGSNYTTKTRRTLHGGHAVYGTYPELGFTESLAPWARERFASFAARGERMKDATEAALRAVIAKDEGGYRAALDTLQPNVGPHGRTTLTLYLSKVVLQMRLLRRPEQREPDDLHRWVDSSHPITLNWGPDFTARFTDEEAVTLWQRFKGIDAALQSDEEMFEPAFQGRPMRYFFNELPAGVDCESFIAGW